MTIENTLISKIGSWLRALSMYNLDDAQRYQKEISEMIHHIHVSKQAATYYDLVHFKHQFVTGQMMHQPMAQHSIKLKEATFETNNILNYLYHFNEGMIATSVENYLCALKHFKEAEKHIIHVNNYEQAEFYIRIANVFYRLDQNITALSYLNQAYDIIKGSKDHMRLQMNCLIMKAGIYSELGYYEKSNTYTSYAQQLTNKEPYHRSLVHYAKANNEYRHGHFEKALKSYTRAHSDSHQKKTMIRIKSKYHIANTHFKLGMTDRGHELLDEVESSIAKEALQLNEYSAKCLISRGLHAQMTVDLSLIDQGLTILQENNLHGEFSEVCNDLSKHFRDHEDFENAYRYLHLSNEASGGKHVIGGD
ncbi:hypothetical protein DH09_17300 [Bacillaceae bacterium JMAK1]|nr:hypothetical protein DH09_17300 [Bacillaceae bacterium JMAK1]